MLVFLTGAVNRKTRGDATVIVLVVVKCIILTVDPPIYLRRSIEVSFEVLSIAYFLPFLLFFINDRSPSLTIGQ